MAQPVKQDRSLTATAARANEAPARGAGPDIGTRIAYAGVGIIFLGMAAYAWNVRQLARDLGHHGFSEKFPSCRTSTRRS